ncbi:MAG TPA: SCO family protein, partial [Phenylobacterium sp.]
GLAWRGGLFTGRESPAPSAIGGPFQMVDQSGRPVTEAVLRGKWSAVFFGFTYCPDICPTTLQTLVDAKAKLGRKGEDLQILFVSVDPARDTPQQLTTYLQSYPGVIGLTGTPEQLAATTKAFKVWYAKRGEGEGYTMDHSSAVYLMDPKGRFTNAVAVQLGPDRAAQDIAREMQGG